MPKIQVGLEIGSKTFITKIGKTVQRFNEICKVLRKSSWQLLCQKTRKREQFRGSNVVDSEEDVDRISQITMLLTLKLR